VPSRRLDDRIRDLCAAIVKSPKDVPESVLNDLQTAIRQKVETLRTIAAKRFSAGGTNLGDANFRDRRSRANDDNGKRKAS
jgi:hypothetical protein